MEKTFDTSKIKVAVGLSGGVDSSVAAWLLKQAGFDVTGVYLRCYWTHEGCTADKDRASAAKVASFLDLPFEVWDFEKEYKEKVIDYFYAEYEKGRTPNPDIVCNREIKFGLFYEKAVKDGGFNFIATGHYAGCGLQDQRSKIKDQKGWIFPFYYQKITEGDNKDTNLVVEPKYFELLEVKGKNKKRFDTYYNGPRILGGVDEKKDQSYFLYDIEKNAIEHSLYPLFGLLKSQVRQIAVANNLPTANRPDSQGICFIGEINIEKFLKERIPEHPGEVIDVSGNVIGSHKGIEFYTIGQRHGFQINSVRVAQRPSFKDSQLDTSAAAVDVGKETNIPAKPRSGCGLPREVSSLANPESSYKGPLYVIGKDIEKNWLIVGAGEECNTDRFKVKIGRNDQFPITNFQTNPNGSGANDQSLFVRIRNLGEMIPCEVAGAGFGSDLKGTAGGSDPVKDSLKESTAHGAVPLQRSLLSKSSPGKITVSSTFEVKLEYPVFGIAPGQSAVFYREIVNSRSGPQNGRCQSEEKDSDCAKPRLRTADYLFGASTANSHSLGTDSIWEVVGGGVIE